MNSVGVVLYLVSIVVPLCQDFVQAVKYAQEAVKRGSADGHLLMGLFHLGMYCRATA